MYSNITQHRKAYQFQYSTQKDAVTTKPKWKIEHDVQLAISLKEKTKVRVKTQVSIDQEQTGGTDEEPVA